MESTRPADGSPSLTLGQSRPQQDDPSEPGGPTVKRPRKTRQVLSCEECKRRKVACDRAQPCAPCIARGEGNDCSYKNPKREGGLGLAPKPAAGASSAAAPPGLLDMARRLHHLEELFANKFGDAPRYSATAHKLVLTPSQDSPGSKSSPERGTEEAVLTLEELAMDSEGRYGSLGISMADNFGRPDDAPPVFQLSSSNWSPTVTSPFALTPSTSSALAIFLAPMMDPSQTTVFDCVLATIPSKLVADELLLISARDIDWRWHVLHTPTFADEYADFWRLSSAERNYVDPAWLAVFCQVLSVAAAEALQSELPPVLNGAGLMATREAPAVWHEAARVSLRLADWTAKPQIRVLQCLLLFGASLDHPGSPFTSKCNQSDQGFSIWMSAATRIAHLLGLHRLGTDKGRMPALDPSLPPFPCSLRREMGVRLWYWLVILDWKTNVTSGDFLIGQSSFDTGPLRNLDDADIGLSVDTVSRDSWEHTSTSYQRYQLALAEHLKRVAQLLLSKSTEDYQAILQLETELKETIKPLVPRGNTDHRFSLESALHNRILRLHRPFMVKGYQQTEFNYSTSTCLESAERILQAHQGLGGSSHGRTWFIISHALGACLCLCVDTFIRQSRGQAAVPERVQLVQQARDRFHYLSTDSSSSIRGIASKAVSVLDHLASIEAEEIKTLAEQQDGNLDLGPLFRTVAASVTESQLHLGSVGHSNVGGEDFAAFFHVDGVWPGLDDLGGRTTLDNPLDWSQFWGTYLTDAAFPASRQASRPTSPPPAAHS